MKKLDQTAVLLVMLLVPFSGFAADSAANNGEQKTMGERWDATVESIGAYSTEQRDKALEAGKRTLDAMDRRIERMEAWSKTHWASLSEEAREKRTAMLESLRKRRNDAAEWYGGMKHSTTETWDGVKNGFIDSYGRLRNAYDESVESFGPDDGESGEAGDSPGESGEEGGGSG